MNIKKKESQMILQALAAGVVPRTGIAHFMVGRTEELEQIRKELDMVKNGMSLVKFIVGDFGSGKSLIQGWTRHFAFEQKFVVADCDFSPERRLYGGEGAALATYTELMKNLSTATRPEGNALPSIISKWIEEMMTLTQESGGFSTIDFENQDFLKSVESHIEHELKRMENLTGGFDFAKVMSAYFHAYATGNDRLMSCCMRWFRGEYTTKTEAKQDLGVRDIIDDTNWYNYLKVISLFVTRVGYSGLVIHFDEAINLYKMASSMSRDKNYEMILQIFNDCMQGKTEHLYITFAGTPHFLEDDRRGLYSYGALRRRLEIGQNEHADYKNLNQPVMKLYALRQDDAIQTCKRVKLIFETHFDTKIPLLESEIENYVNESYGKLGGAEFTTIGATLRGFVSILHLKLQHPEGSPLPVVANEKKTDTIRNRFVNIDAQEEQLQ